MIGVCAESACSFHDALGFPETIDAGVRVGELRNRAVRYEIGLFKSGSDIPAATGHFVHVFVDRRPWNRCRSRLSLRGALERLTLPGE